MIPKPLIEAIRSQYRLNWHGIHGISHWARVFENGVRLAASLPGVNARVVELFAVFHDARRENEGIDKGHGWRGAELAKQLRGSFFELPDDDLELLYVACCDHTDGRTGGDLTVLACWDADRLDLGRVGIVPDPRYLCTSAAKEPDLIAWADDRAQRRVFPPLVREKWLAD